jgi:hypothetical protein
MILRVAAAGGGALLGNGSWTNAVMQIRILSTDVDFKSGVRLQ